jgi:hypothetical protein
VQEPGLGLIYYITQIQFDFGAVALARAECERLGIQPAADLHRSRRGGGRFA